MSENRTATGKEFSFVASVFSRWLRNDGMGLAAAVSFYALFAIAPLLLLIIVMTSRMIGEPEARSALTEWLSSVVASSDAAALVDTVKLDQVAGVHWGLSAASAVMWLWAISLIFMRLRVGIRRIFEEPRGAWRATLRTSVIARSLALLFALVAGLVISLLLVIASAAVPLSHLLHIDQRVLLELTTVLLFVVGGIVLLAFIPKQRPPMKILLLSGIFLAIALGVSRWLVAAYLVRSMIASAYGVASVVVVSLLWIYFAGCVYFFCAALCAELSSRASGQLRSDGGSPQ
jgi:membrane protein